MAAIRCFLLEPTDRVRIFLRRFSRDNTPDCCPSYPGAYSYHTARVAIGEEQAEQDSTGYVQNGLKEREARNDSRWPAHCSCGYVFQETDEWQRSVDQIYRRVDTGEEMTLREAPVGAMWEAWWVDQFHVPQGGHNLVVKTPGGEWEIDSQASNCTMPEDSKQEHHHCWIRHGTPPDIHVDKNGVTCGAGAGSIQIGNYHGFLHNGYLTAA